MSTSNPLAALRTRDTRSSRTTHSLLFLRGGKESFRVPTPSHRLCIGRGRDCDIRLPDPNQHLSRVHLVVERRPGAVAIRDCSTNGSKVNGQPLSHATRRLMTGDRVMVGPWEIRVEPAEALDRSDTTVAGIDNPTLPIDSPTWRGDQSSTRTWTGEDDMPRIVGRSPAMRRCLDRLLRLASFDVPVVVHGETGTGKELIARALHDHSSRAGKPYIALNCGAIHRETANSTLFGHQPGAFTGATGRRKGVFEEAGQGTLFLDEVAELGLDLQAALLRVLETGEIPIMGSAKTADSRCRFIAATHRDLAQDAAAGRFREDLYYRIHVAGIRVPALRDRGDDVLLLARHFLRRHSPGKLPEFGPGANAALAAHSWPGNVRELRNVVLRALIHCDGEVIRANHLEFDDTPHTNPSGARQQHLTLPPARRADGLLRDELLRSLHCCRGNRSEAARMLGISRSTLYARMERLGLAAEPEDGPGDEPSTTTKT